MYPVLLTIGPFVVSSFGFFLAVGFLSTAFILWRLSKIYDLNEGKILDLLILAFFGGLIGARVYFVASNWNLFNDLGKAVLLNRYPGLSFWGGMAGGILALRLFVQRTKFNFWQIADFGAVGATLGIFWGDIGCFLGGCGFGVESSLPIATLVVGQIGRRFPAPLLEGILFLVLFLYLWKMVIRFHFNGKAAAVFLIFLAGIKFFMGFIRSDNKLEGYIFPPVILILGIVVFYHQSRRNLVADLGDMVQVLTSEKKRSLLLLRLKKSWYNFEINFSIKLSKTLVILRTLPKSLKRRLHVRENPKNLG